MCVHNGWLEGQKGLLRKLGEKERAVKHGGARHRNLLHLGWTIGRGVLWA